jgi:hypothetical protein
MNGFLDAILMGKPIVYCGACGRSLREADFEKGQAHIADSQPYCVKCRPMEAPAAPKPSPQALGTATSHVPRATLSEHPRGEQASSSSALFIGLGVGVAAVLAVIVLASSGGTKSRSSSAERGRRWVEPEASPGPATLRPAAPDREDLAAKKAFDRANEFARTHPLDLEAQARLWEDAVREAQNTSLVDGARLERNRVREKIHEALSRELLNLEDQIRESLLRQDFKKAIDGLEAAQRRHDDPEWRGRLGSRVRELQDSASKLLVSLKAEALDAERRGAPGEARRIVDRVARWGLPDLAADLEQALARARERSPAAPPADPSAKAPSREAETYRERWRGAMALASARDFAAAIKELTSASTSLQEPALREEAAADLRTLRQGAALLQEVGGVLSRWPKGQSITLEFWNETGSPEKLTGTLLRADSGRLVVGKEGDSRFVELGELTASSLVEIWQSQPEKDRKPDSLAAVPLLLILEGGVEKPATLASRLVTEKYVAYAAGLPRGAGIVGGSDRESEARRSFYGLERDYLVFSKTAEAVEGYKSLLKKYADTQFVRRNRASLEERAEGGKEFFLSASDLESTGGFELAKNEKVDFCFTLVADLEPAQVKGTYVDLVFSALPNLEYRCWVQVGACCAEIFQFSYQASDLKGPNPKKSSDMVSLEPGSEFSMPAKNSIVGLKKTHALHGGPPHPARWEWIALPLPKFASPGVKTVRLFSEHRGFSIAGAWVTSLRQTIPRDAEVKEFRKFRPLPQPKPANSSPAPVSKAPGGKLLYSEKFENGSGQYDGGEVVEGGVNGSKAYSIPPKGMSSWHAFSIDPGPSLTFRFSAKPVGDVDLLILLIWSDKEKDNARAMVPLKAGEWKQFEIPLSSFRFGPSGEGAPYQGELFNNIKIWHAGKGEARVLLDDIEIRG